MPKTLILVRHGKAAEHLTGTSDRERTLTREGKDQIAAQSAKLLKKKLIPDIILCSNAKRAYGTAVVFADAFAYSHEEIIIDPDIYEKDADALGRIVVTLPWSGNTALLVGHNPHITWFAREFTGDSVEILPTSGMVAIRFDTDQWADIFLSPREVVMISIPKH